MRTNPATGENIYEKAILLAADGMSPVLKFDYGIETNFPGRVLFDKVPLGLNSTPVLKPGQKRRKREKKNCVWHI